MVAVVLGVFCGGVGGGRDWIGLERIGVECCGCCWLAGGEGGRVGSELLTQFD